MTPYTSCTRVSQEGIRWISGMTAYDEQLLDGRLVGRYLNPCGQVMPEMHLHPDWYLQETDSVFHIRIAGQDLVSGWQHIGTVCEDNSSAMTLKHTRLPLQVTVHTQLDGKGWITRWLQIQNLGEEALPVDSVAPFSGKIWCHLFKPNDEVEVHYLPQECGIGADKIYDVGYSPLSRWGSEGDFGFHPVQEEGLTYDAGMNGKSGWSRPAFVLRDNLNGQLFCCEFGYSGNWEMQVRPQVTPKFTTLNFSIGIKAPEGECVRVLLPGETVDTPAVHFTVCAEGMQKLIQSRHRFIREEIMPQNEPIGQCLIEANHRGYLCDRENEADIIRDVSVAAQIGAELYVIDAGWYGSEPNIWYENAGDWFAGSWLPNDLHPIIAHAKSLGMKFGLWMEIEAAGGNTRLQKEHPEFLMRRNGQPCCEGRALDLSKKEVIAWLEQQIADVITRYDLDMFRIDHNHRLNESGTAEIAGYTENVLWRYMENLYAMFDRLNKRFPKVSFQNCAAGGGRLDLGILRYFHHTEVTDWVRPPREARIFNGLAAQLPPEIQLRTIGTEAREHVQDGDLLAQLHNVMQSRMIFRGIAPSIAELAQPMCALVQKELKLYKERLRPILTGECKLFRHDGQNGVLDPEPWSVNEFALPDASAAYAVVQRLAATDTDTFLLRPRGLKGDKKYRVVFDRREDTWELTGTQLMQQGIPVQIDNIMGSELLTFTEIKEG